MFCYYQPYTSKAGIAKSSQWPSACPYGEKNCSETVALIPTQESCRGKQDSTAGRCCSKTKNILTGYYGLCAGFCKAEQFEWADTMIQSNKDIWTGRKWSLLWLISVEIEENTEP